MWTGDNLDIMRGMNSESVDLIYLDPPFNSNKNYSAPIGSEAAGVAFKDTWTLDDLDVAWHGEIADKHPALYSIIDSAGMAHGKGMRSYLIMMAVRLLEMKRLLNGTGSIYLHCDPTASHYLKLVLDCVFGATCFRNEIIWKRATSRAKGSQYLPKTWGTNTDTLLFYSMGDDAKVKPYKELTTEEVVKKFPKVDENGERYKDDSHHIWCTPNMGDRPNLCYEWRGYTNPHPSGWRLSKARLEEEFEKGNIRIKQNGKLERRAYSRDYRGEPTGNLWDDILPIQGKERTGYPTQKPLGLLDRIIKASSHEDDMVLDPFCGCATACVAAERLDRQWVGIDIAEKAVNLVQSRIRKEIDLFHNFTPIQRSDIPKRTDLGDLPNYRTHKHQLYGKQEGICAGCRTLFPFRNMTVDHIIPQSKGGGDHFDNLQLLCGACNSTKGSRPQEHLIAKLKADGII